MWSFDSSYSLGFFVLICGWYKLIKFRGKKGSSSVNTCFNVSSLGYVFLNFFISVSFSISLSGPCLSLFGVCLSLSLCVYVCFKDGEFGDWGLGKSALQGLPVPSLQWDVIWIKSTSGVGEFSAASDNECSENSCIVCGSSLLFMLVLYSVSVYNILLNYLHIFQGIFLLFCLF